MATTAATTATSIEWGFIEDWTARYHAAWSEHDIEAVVAMCAPDVIWDDPALPETYHGREGVRRFVTATFRAFPDAEVDMLEPPYLSPNLPRALAPYRFKGTMTGPWEPTDLAPTGARVEFDGIDQWEFRDELLARYDTKYDLLGVARQMGVMPPHGSRTDRIMTRLQHLQARGQRRKASATH
jgi:steroid delta-isomerase-like uncharacterized protein